MTRVVGVVAATALALALCFVMTKTAAAAQTQRIDVGAQLMLTLFGENSDSAASFQATQGDRASESPLRDLVLRVGSVGTKPVRTGAVTAFETDRLTLAALATDETPRVAPLPQLSVERTAVRFSPPSANENDGLTLASSDRYMAAYQPVPPLTAVSPAPGTVAFTLPQVRPLEFLPATQQSAVRFTGSDQNSTPEAPQAALHDTSYGAGANFDVRAGKRTVNLNLSSEYEHVGRNDANAFSTATLGSASSWQLPGGAPLAVPGYADLNRLSVGAGFSLPVTRGVTLNLNYDAQHVYGGYGLLPGLTNLDSINNSYGGKLTLNMPRISSSLSISAYQDKFQDNLLPLNGSTQTREDVNFTVKF